MANTTSDTETTIEVLLEQRAQYEGWLARLDASGDKAPPAVRQRVRGDYEARLQAVMEQLRGRGAAISEELERHHASQAELDRERRTAEEALAEAEVRHAVGEYGEDEWRRLSEQSRREIDQLRARLRSVGGEITRLTEVQTLVAAPRGAAAAPSAPAPKPEIVEEAPFVTHVAEPIVEAVPAPPSPPPPSQRPAARPARTQPEPAAPSDELAFLKSVSDDEHRPAARRPSNEGSTAPSVTTTAPRTPEPNAQTATSVSGKAPSGVAKTLKCGECGTLNRPTEWYCERCGAELAGV